MIPKKEVMLFEYIKMCNEYFSSRKKSLLSEISDIHRRDLNTQNFIFNAFPKESRCYSARINLESAEDISSIDVGDTFKFSNLVDAPVRVWCKDKDKLQRFVEHKLYANTASSAIIVTELINRKNILFDFDHYNTMVECGSLIESFTEGLRDEARAFKPLNIRDTVKEVLVSSLANKAEVIEVLKPHENINTRGMADEIRKSFGY